MLSAADNFCLPEAAILSIHPKHLEMRGGKGGRHGRHCAHALWQSARAVQAPSNDCKRRVGYFEGFGGSRVQYRGFSHFSAAFLGHTGETHQIKQSAFRTRASELR